MVTSRFAATRPEEHAALIRALAETAAWCDEPHHREQLADLLATDRYLSLPARVLAPALGGRFDCGNGRVEHVPDFVRFHRGDANVPAADKAVALQRALGAANLLSPVQAADATLPLRLFREDLHREILHTHQPNEIVTS